MPTRQDAWELVNEYTENQNLVRHMLAVEAAMRAYARQYGEDEELWATVGLVHDFDYERYPDLSVEGHPVVGARILRERGWPEEIVRAVLAHAGEYTGCPARVADGKGAGRRGRADRLSGGRGPGAPDARTSATSPRSARCRKSGRTAPLPPPSTARRSSTPARRWAWTCGPSTCPWCWRRCRRLRGSWGWMGWGSETENSVPSGSLLPI